MIICAPGISLKKLLWLFAAGLVILVLAGCDNSSVTIVRPRHPLTIACFKESFDARRLLGLNEGPGRKVAEKSGCELRVVERDGHELPILEDRAPYRIDVAVTSGLIVRITETG
jgi:hypothetical protein